MPWNGDYLTLWVTVAALGLDKDWPMTKVSLVLDQVEYFLVVHYYNVIHSKRKSGCAREWFNLMKDHHG